MGLALEKLLFAVKGHIMGTGKNLDVCEMRESYSEDISSCDLV